MSKKLVVITALFLALPFSAAAASISADDSVAGLGTDIDIAGFPANTSVHVVVSPPLGAEILLPVQTDTSGAGSVQLKGRDTEVAGIYTITIEKSGIAYEGTAHFEVLPDSLSTQNSSIQVSSDTIQPTGTDKLTVAVIIRDTYGNPLPNRPLKLISSRAADRISSMESETDESGEQLFSLTTKEQGILHLRAIDLLSGTLIDAEADVQAGTPSNAVGGPLPTVNSVRGRQLFRAGSNFVGDVTGNGGSSFGLIDHFELFAPRELEINEDTTIKITAVDRNGNRVEDYTGLALISSTDPMAFLPVGGEVRFEPRNLGQKVLTLGLRFRTADEHILYVEDSENPEIFGQAYVTVTGGYGSAPGSKVIQILSPEIGTVFNVPQITITGVTEPFVNLIVSGGKEDVRGETDIEGRFAITITLDSESGKQDHMLRVRDEFGQLDSGEFSVVLDNIPPQFESVEFSPSNPTEGTNVLLVVKSEPDLPVISADIAGAQVSLDPVPGQPGMYQYLFVAPVAGAYQPIISVADSAGNTAQFTSSLVSELEGLPKVTNIQATGEANAVTLQWDPISTEPIDAYRIYVGETATRFDFNLDTNFTTTAAQVAGLIPGKEYFFSVTALQGERESQEFDVVSALVKGLLLDVSPQHSGLLIDWSSIVTDTPLSSFILEFGVEPDTFTEKRILNGELRNYTLRDLINGVTYFLKLTPVDITGQLVEDLAATAEGIPTGEGFAVTPGDTVPFDTRIRTVNRSAAPPDMNRNAPHTVPSGLPTVGWWALVTLAAGGLMFYWQRKRKLQATVAFFREMESRYKQK
ncbi:hypothetical protein COU78_04160 [Candidatus Peregrinibacteria bacterium CG10_big_fil_rev_8_21_14_0_10_49_24]|nr:MAG: hypothetical protein COV83_00695 [Candidatus Peregrinibacteria bacterium CG11_big_fil_rev_8_21_14_0_20_49_14]PIR50862.1 MAG: hypothetical protein COU78_04160 [Candidatus Peregrinibacteria bacterium CG10_big_fil_rev_8_21_14_0_10_49_24]PJA67139.1 MAG: hypothetical protein CO157_06090 [Candidatus Peregrinibacteria bacterium CG_4_9_14_3_um_filter_49_12]